MHLTCHSFAISNKFPLPHPSFSLSYTLTLDVKRFTMKFVCTALLLTLSIVNASFLRDVARAGEKTAKQDALESALLEKAMPLGDYRKKVRAQGFDIPEQKRHLAGDAGDDYFINNNNMYSFDGYSLKYAKCQPVQRFSDNAISAGQYSPMVTDDIAILRLCPARFCSSSRTFGCQFNYAEYAIGLTDYVRIMLRYKMDKDEQMCDWCTGCARRKLDDQAGDENGDGDGDGDGDGEAADDNDEAAEDNGEAADDYVAAAADDYVAAAADDDDDGNKWWQNGGNGDDTFYSDDSCYNYKSYCYDDDGSSVCQADGDDDYNRGDDNFMATEDYLDYLDCANIKDNDNLGYFVRPRCDGYKETIKMGVFYDKFCSQYAGNEVSLKNFGLGFRDSAFQEFYEDTPCIDCSQSVSKIENPYVSFV